MTAGMEGRRFIPTCMQGQAGPAPSTLRSVKAF